MQSFWPCNFFKTGFESYLQQQAEFRLGVPHHDKFAMFIGPIYPAIVPCSCFN